MNLVFLFCMLGCEMEIWVKLDEMGWKSSGKLDILMRGSLLSVVWCFVSDGAHCFEIRNAE